MLSTDRQDYETAMAQLCAGYDKPIGERMEAYWKGLGKMGLVEFQRIVEFCLSEEGPEKLPNCSALWAIRKRLKSQQRPAVQTPARSSPAGGDHLEYFANRLLLQHATARGGLGSVGGEASREVTACLTAKQRLVDEFLEYVREGDELATPAEFIRAFAIVIGKVSKVDEQLLAHWRSSLQTSPFPAYMARELAPKQAEFA
jgi:hypothetical protein